MKQTAREKIARAKEIKAAWKMPTQEETAAYLTQEYKRPYTRAAVYEAERRAIEKIKRELMKWMQERRKA